MEILVGCDPEVFVKEGNKNISAHGLIPGDKRNPFPVRNGAVQVDGMALEFNINPAKNADEFVNSVQDVLNQLQEMIPGKKLFINPDATFSQEVFDSQPKEALELGCDPDFDSYTGLENPRPDGSVNFRTASGHVHIGWTSNQDIHDPSHRDDAFMVGRVMDFYLGLPGLALEPKNKRRALYGKAGCVRVKPYGVEYRTLSNFWLTSPKLMRWVYDQVLAGMRYLEKGGNPDNLRFKDYYDVQQIINTGDVYSARYLSQRYNLLP